MSFRKRMLKHGPRTGVLAASIGALIATGGLTSTALGQDEEDEESAADDAIVVTGTRIRRDDFTSTNATVTVTSEDMRNLGITSVAEMVNQLPSNVANVTPETSADSTFNMGASVANLRGLNAGGGARTLVLVDSRRVIASNSSGVVDMNMIPTALVGRIETVTGGASATYGADAMAGVVNVILDNSIEDVRIDLSYQTTAEGDGDNVTLSVGTGFEVFDRRGSIQVGYDRSNQDGIGDCTQAREVCRRSFGIFQNGTPTGGNYSPMAGNQYLPGQVHYIISEGFRYGRPPEGYWTNGANPNPADPLGCLAAGIYRFTADGRNLEPMYNELTNGERSLIMAGAEGPNSMTPFGQGALSYAGVPVLPETTRDNLYTRFAYDFEGGVELETSISYGKTESWQKQNSARQSWYGSRTYFLRNAFLQPEWGTSQFVRDVFQARQNQGAPGNTQASNPPTTNFGFPGCTVAPFIGNPGASVFGVGGSSDVTTYDVPQERCVGGAVPIHKDVSPFVDRANTTDTEQWTWSVAANGDLFEGGSWTWDASLSFGESQRDVEVKGWQSTRRLEMAENSEWDSTANGGLGAPVCAIDNNEPYQMTDPLYTNPPGGTQGDYWEWKWLNYIQRSIDNNNSGGNAQEIFDTLSGRNGIGPPCAPFNPFGNEMYPGSIDFAYPSILDANNNTQTVASVSFSGDAWRGFGNAGPVRMAAGVDFRLDETDNGSDQNNILDRDFGLNFADDWNGEVETQEAFVEFEVPLLRDKPGADYVMTNLAYRYTDNTTRRLAGAGNFNPNTEDKRSIESWKASMVWRPVDLFTVRITRSNDTRAPSPTELFAANAPATSASSTFTSPFRYNNSTTPQNDQSEEVLSYAGAGGNPFLGEETSLTQTVGFVFTPTEVLAGFSLSIDYYETNIKGGISDLSTTAVATNCRDQLIANGYNLAAAEACQNIVFGDPLIPEDDIMMLNAAGQPNPLYPFVNIIEIAPSTANNMPFLSRGLDVSASYSTQLGGGGFISARLLATRSLEQRVTQTGGVSNAGLGPTFDVSGQTGSQGIGSIWSWAANIFTDYAPTPRISGNAFLTYNKNAFTTTGQVRYVGTGALTKQTLWLGPGDCGTWYSAGGTVQNYQCFDPTRSQMVTDNDLPSWTTLNLTFEYDFSRSRFEFDRFNQLSIYLDIDNVLDKNPDQFSGNGTGAQNTTYFSVMGRTMQLGARMAF